MKKLALIIILSACAKERVIVHEGSDGKKGASCTVSQVTEGSLILCEDGTSVTIKDGINGSSGATGASGAAGSAGAAGQNGQDASSCTVVQTQTGANITCPNGTSATLLNGINGVAGQNGAAGTNGTSCTVMQVTPSLLAPNGGALITCGVTTALLLNGETGATGSQGNTGNTGAAGQNGTNAVLPPFSVLTLLDPCGDAPGIYDEVFFKLVNGTVIASFSNNFNGDYTRLSVISPGSFITTDASNCYFSVDANGNLFNEHY